jgi:hypothetical protein
VKVHYVPNWHTKGGMLGLAWVDRETGNEKVCSVYEATAEGAAMLVEEVASEED